MFFLHMHTFKAFVIIHSLEKKTNLFYRIPYIFLTNEPLSVVFFFCVCVSVFHLHSTLQVKNNRNKPDWCYS